MIKRLYLWLKEILLGRPLNAFNYKTRENIALIAVIAWVGLGADGLSSAAYGPEQAFLALGSVNNATAIYLALATAITVFIIALAYNQVIELFPDGGGGYKVAMHLLGPKFAVVSGSALIVDYILTIAVSVAGAVDAGFSMLPTSWLEHKVLTEVLLILLLLILNMRGMKESIKLLLPLFLGFLLTHVVIIVLGFSMKHASLLQLLPHANQQFSNMQQDIGLLATLAIILRAYSLGGGTYTGLEAVSNNVNILAEPRVRTGKLTMLYMALSLSFTAGGIILLYLLWHVAPENGKTLNATLFASIINANHSNLYWLPIILFFEMALLLVGANTGFLGCPAIMANMAADRWLPRQFRELSDRLVKQNGLLLSGVAAIIILIWARGKVSTLVVFYSINVFVTFSLSLLGLIFYWWRQNEAIGRWWRLALSFIGFIVCVFILFTTTLEKFSQGAWATVVVTALLVLLCFLIKRHYDLVDVQLDQIDEHFLNNFNHENGQQIIGVTEYDAKTAVCFVNRHFGSGIRTVLTINNLFPNTFKNFVFISAGEIDAAVLSLANDVQKVYRRDLQKLIEHFRYFCSTQNLPSEGMFSYGVSESVELMKLAGYVMQMYDNCVFFASKLVFVEEKWWTRLLHNNVLYFLQRELHLRGKHLVILPIKL